MQETQFKQGELKRYWQYALYLAIGTVIFNFAEGAVSLYFGIREEALSLLGFGLDSFIETISALGIAHMVMRISRSGETFRDKFERTALRITAWCLISLALILVLGAGISIFSGREPGTTIPGAIIASISILLMGFLIGAKNYIGKKLSSQPIIADSRCNLVCIYMSVILLVSSLLYEFFAIPYIDALGALGIAWFSWKEGREALAKSRSEKLEDCC